MDKLTNNNNIACFF